MTRKLTRYLPVAVVCAACLFVAVIAFAGAKPATPEWAINATTIEACSCPMFCQCYFNAEPAGHHAHAGAAEHFCKFNNAYKVNKGHYGAAKLDGAKFWIAGDLGGDFSKGQMDWASLYFDKALTPAQREAIGRSPATSSR